MKDNFLYLVSHIQKGIVVTTPVNNVRCYLKQKSCYEKNIVVFVKIVLNITFGLHCIIRHQMYYKEKEINFLVITFPNPIYSFDSKFNEYNLIIEED